LQLCISEKISSLIFLLALDKEIDKKGSSGFDLIARSSEAISPSTGSSGAENSISAACEGTETKV
jgi:hypothetical protein